MNTSELFTLLLSAIIQSVQVGNAYVKMDYPDYCFYDPIRYDNQTGYFIYLNPVSKVIYNITEEALVSTSVIRLNYGFICSVILHGMRDPMRPWVLCCKLL